MMGIKWFPLPPPHPYLSTLFGDGEGGGGHYVSFPLGVINGCPEQGNQNMLLRPTNQRANAFRRLHSWSNALTWWNVADFQLEFKKANHVILLFTCCQELESQIN